MLNLNMIQNNSIIICPSNKKEFIIKQRNRINFLKNIKFIDKQTLIKELYFAYDLETIVYLYKKYNYQIPLAYELLDNLWNISMFNDKLNKLYRIYEDLKSHNLLKLNPFFKNIFINKKVYIYGYSHLDIELKTILKKLNISYEYLDENNDTYEHNVLVFNTIEEEIIYVVNKICELSLNGISLNNIYLYLLPSEYNLIVKKYFNMYNLPFDLGENIYLYDSPYYKKYLTYLKELSFTDAYSKLKAELINDPLDVLGSLADLLVNILSLNNEKSDVVEMLNYLSKNKALKKIKYLESIKICTPQTVITDTDYVFMLGFSQGNYPKIYKDTDFLTDLEKEALSKNTSKILNQIETNQISQFIKTTKNLSISYKKQYGKTTYYSSTLISKLNLKEKIYLMTNIRYSIKQTRFEVAKHQDMNRFYGIKHKNLNTFKDDELKYNTFDHSFKGLKEQQHQHLNLSYTQISEYNSCPFRYFVKRILKADVFEEKFTTNLGTLYHQILEDAVNFEINLSDYDEFINEHFSTYKEKYFVKLLLPQVLDVIKINQGFIENSCFNNVIVEDELKYDIDEDTTLIGKIDKTLIDDSDQNLVVIDYKTGTFSFNKEKVEYGLDMQLPIYAYLLSKKYSSYNNVGMYIQNVCLNKKELLEKNKYQLHGLTLNDKNKITRLDNELGTTYDENGKRIGKSRYIKGVSIISTGELGKSNNLVTSLDLQELVTLCESKLKETIENIRNNKFEIAPVKFTNDQHAHCVYCKFKDICFKTYHDIKHIEIKKQVEESDGE